MRINDRKLTRTEIKTPSFKTNLTANYAGAALTAILSVVFTPIYIRLLGSEAYGLVGFFTSIVVVAQIFDLGLGSTFNRELAKRSAANTNIDQTHDLVKSIELVYVSIGILLGLLFFILAPIMARYWFHPIVLTREIITRSLMIMAVAFGLRFCSSLYIAGLSGLQRQVPINVVNIFITLAQYGGAIFILEIFKYSVIVFFIYQGIIGLAQTLVLRIFLMRLMPLRIRKATWSPHLLTGLKKFSLGMTGISLTAVLLTQADRLVLSGIMPLETYGYYIFAANAAMALWRIAGPVFNAVFPRLTVIIASGDKQTLALFYRKTTQFMAVMIVPLAATIVIFAEPLLLIWTKRPDLVRLIVDPFRLLIIGYALNALMNIPYALQLAHGWTSLAFKVNVVWLAILLPGLWMGYRTFGIIAATSLWPILNLGYILITIPIMHYKIERQLMKDWYLFSVLVPVLFSAILISIIKLLLPTYNNLFVIVGFLAFVFIILIFIMPDIRGATFDFLARKLKLNKKSQESK